jgi:hypothetical protein
MCTEADVRAALAAIQSPPTPYADIDKTIMTETTEHEMTYAANKGGMMVKKKGAKLRRRRRSGMYVCSFSNACALLTIFLGGPCRH